MRAARIATGLPRTLPGLAGGERTIVRVYNKPRADRLTGFRLPVETILELLSAGAATEDILRD